MSDSLNARIPSLDGLRAISIILVVIGHWGATDAGSHVPLWLMSIFGNGSLGVTVFFVLSGFLITTLLVKEYGATGRVSIKDFYIRRAFRIWPAFYALLGCVAVLGAFHAIQVTRGELLSSGLYFWNYYPYGKCYFLAHTWSLSVEEQFYVLWPLLLGLAGPRRAVWVAFALIVLEPFIRVGTYLLVPSMRAHIPIMVHTRADSLMIGSWAALLYRNGRFQGWLQKLFAWRLPLIGGIYVFFIDIFLTGRWGGAYMLPVGYSVQNVCIALLMLWAIQHPFDNLFGRLLNARVAVHIGHISYSLYLWHVLFLSRENTTVSGTLPWNWILAIGVAELSYWFIEQPFLGLRRRLDYRTAIR